MNDLNVTMKLIAEASLPGIEQMLVVAGHIVVWDKDTLREVLTGPTDIIRQEMLKVPGKMREAGCDEVYTATMEATIATSHLQFETELEDIYQLGLEEWIVVLKAAIESLNEHLE